MNQTLNQEETEALVRAMTSRVEILHLESMPYDDDGFFTLDFDTFRKYLGDGKCREIHIAKGTEYDLTTLLDSVNCKELHLFTGIVEKMSKKETEALVRAMTSRVEILQLGTKDDDQYDDHYDNNFHTGVNLDIDMLTQYKGDGKCREVHCNCVCIGEIFSMVDYGDGLKQERNYKYINEDKIADTWAEKMNWDINEFRKKYARLVVDARLLTRKKDV